MSGPSGPALAGLLLAAMLSLLPGIPAVRAAEACGGRDLFPRLRAETPAAFGAIEAAGRAMPFGTGLLLRLSRDGREPSYLFGTLHVSDARATGLSEAVRAAIAGADLVALEVAEPDTRPRQGAQPAARPTADVILLAPSDRRPERLLDAPALEALRAAVKRRGLPASAADTYKPAVLALLLDMPTCAAARPGDPPIVDAAVAEAGRGAGAKVIGLETVGEQVEALGELSEGDARTLLVASTRLAPHAEDMHETAIARYLARDPGGLAAWMTAPALVPGVEDARYPAAFLEALLDGRNRRMHERARPLLEAGRAFVAVGAAHLPGENGLARLFERDGYRVEVVE